MRTIRRAQAADGEDILATMLVCLCEDMMLDAQPFAEVEKLVASAAMRRTKCIGVGGGDQTWNVGANN